MGWGAALGSAFGSVLNFGLGMSNQASQGVWNAEQLAFAREQMAMQKEFAQHGLRWKVDDAKAAGVHPLFAMGAATNSFTPVSSGQSFSPTNYGDMSASLGQMGQGIERAIDAGRTKTERNERMNDAASEMQSLQLENAQLQNDYLRANIFRINSQLGPPMPSLSPGGGLTGQQPGVVTGLGPHEMKPVEVDTSKPRDLGHSAGPPMPSVKWAVTADGRGLQAFPPKSLGVEDELGAPLMLDWYARNRLMPNVDPGGRGPTLAEVRAIFPSATGAVFSRTEQRWVPTFGRGDGDYRVPYGGPGVRDGLRSLYYNRATPSPIVYDGHLSGAYFGRRVR